MIKKILSLVKISCPNCGASMSPENYLHNENMFRCMHCNSIFASERTFNEGKEAKVVQRPEIPMPEKFQVSQSQGFYIISRKWFGIKYVFLIFFALFWNGFMITWHSMALSSGQYIMSVFGIMHTVVGIILAYITLTGIINRTNVKIGRGKLVIVHRPLWWPGSGEYSISEFQQFFSTEKIHKGKNGTTYTYELFGKTHAGSRKKLISGLENTEQALFLEQKIENFFGIKDEPVSGEIPRQS